MLYNKPAISVDEQLELLQERGLNIPNFRKARVYLENISYYRLVGYWWPMFADKETHVFKPGSNFDDAVALYNFDQELRLLLTDVLEKIEISLRTKLIYHLSREIDPWWFQNAELFQDVKAWIETLNSIAEEVARSKDTFIKEHNRKYKDDKRFPPAWKTLELTSFGSLSKLYGNLKPSIGSKDSIAKDYGAANHTYLHSWLQSMAQIRNYCAHHSRVWNRNLPGTPKLLPKPHYPWLKDVPLPHEFPKLYIHLCLMKYMLDRIYPHNKFRDKLEQLMDAYAGHVDPEALGLKPDWKNEELWNS